MNFKQWFGSLDDWNDGSPDFYIKRDRQPGNRKPFLHQHSGLEFGTVVSGSCKRIYDKNEVIVNSGDLFLIHCPTPHGNTPYKKKSYEKVFVFLNQTVMQHLIPQSGDYRLMLPFLGLSHGLPHVIKGANSISQRLIRAHDLCSSKDNDKRLLGWPEIICVLIENISLSQAKTGTNL